nr:MAG TPA: Transcriptional regulator, RHH-like, CopG [Caudoviricetes sp.]
MRIDNETHEKLLRYCEENKVTKAEAIRKGIQLVLQEK